MVQHPLHRSVATTLLVGLLTAPLTAQQISWHDTVAAAKEAAEQGKTPILVAWTMPQGRGDREVCDALADKDVRKAMGMAAAIHYRLDPFLCGEPKLPRGAEGPPKENLQPSEHDALLELMGISGEGAMPEPSLIALFSPEGESILHHVGRLKPGELVWMIERAVREVDPEAKLPDAGRDGVHAPKGVEFAPAEGWNQTAAPLSEPKRKAALENLQRANRQPRREDLNNAVALLRLADAETQQMLEGLARGTGAARRGGGGMGRILLPRALTTIASLGPREWSPFCLESIGDRDERIQHSAAATLEELADPKLASALLKESRRSEDMQLRGLLLRAAAAAGPDKSAVQKDVFRSAEKAKDPVLRAHAMVACGHLLDRDKVLEALRKGLTDPAAPVRTAAAFTAAWWREDGIGLELKAAVLSESDQDVKAMMQAGADATLGGPLSPFRRFCRDYLVLGVPGVEPAGNNRNRGGGGGAGGGGAGPSGPGGGGGGR